MIVQVALTVRNADNVWERRRIVCIATQANEVLVDLKQKIEAEVPLDLFSAEYY